MFEQVQFWLSKQVAELIWGLGVFLLFFTVIGAIYLSASFANWRDKRKRERKNG